MSNAKSLILILGFLMMEASVSLASESRSKAELFPSQVSRSNIYLENQLVRISVEDADGSIGIGTSSLHPTRPCQTLLYGFSCGGNSCSTQVILRVDGINHRVLGCGACDASITYLNSVISDGRIVSSWTLASPPITIQVTHTPILFSSTIGAILTQTFVTNSDSAAHEIGVLYEYDTMVASNDAATLAAGGSWYPNETCFDNPTFTYWEAFESGFPPGASDLVGRGTITGGDAVTPDRLALGAWGSFWSVCWDYTCTGNAYGDSSVLYWWDPETLQPQQTRRVATYYGIGALQTTPGNLSISLSYTTALTCNGSQLTPNPFGLTAYITNTGASYCNNLSSTLALNSGLTTTDPLTVSLGNIAPLNTVQAYWNVTATGNPCGANIPFTVHVASSGCDPNSAQGAVTVPCCPTPLPPVIPTTTASGGLALMVLISLVVVWIMRKA